MLTGYWLQYHRSFMKDGAKVLLYCGISKVICPMGEGQLAA